VSAVIAGVGLVFAAVILHGIAPRFAARFDEIDMPMPSLTAWMLEASRLAACAWGLWALAAFAPLWMWWNRVSSTPLALGLVVVILAGVAISTVAFMLPFQSILVSIGGKR